MNTTVLEKKKMLQETMVSKIVDVLKRGKKTDPPAYTLVLGAGASFGVVPTAKEMLGFPDVNTKKVHERAIPVWLANQLDGDQFADDAARLDCCKAFWKKFVGDNSGSYKDLQIDSDGFPTAPSIAAAYQSLFETSCVGGLDTPERHRNYMRAVTMSAEPGSTQLNATHFYLASLLSLQKRAGEAGSDKKPFYTGRREFARTIFTTNFDPLLQTSLQLFQLLYYMTDRPEFLSADALQTDHHPAIHLFYAHGSVHRPYMANTEEQINLLKQQNARDLAAYLGNHGVIVLGYSGWDDCLLEALNQTKTFSNNLYWLARGADSISEAVRDFLMTHPNAYWVQIDDGGNFMAELHTRLCPGAPNTEMLYNPIRPLLSQLQCVNLAGIEGGGSEKDKDVDVPVSAFDLPRDVETIRTQVIARLEDAQRLFTAPSAAESDLDELERQANLSYANKDWDAALAGYDRLLRQEMLPVGPRSLALLRSGVVHGNKGEIEKEIANYSALIALPGAPVNQVAAALFNRGLRYSKQGEDDKAIADYSAVIELPGTSERILAMALLNRGVRQGKKGESAPEIADYSAVINLQGAPSEQVAKARNNRALCYGQTGEIDNEIADYSAVIDLPGAPVEQVAKARLNRGLCYGRKGEVEKEIADYSAVIDLPGALTDHVAKARINRGVCHAANGDVDEAIGDYSAVIDLSEVPADVIAQARLNRAACYTQKAEKNRAAADYSAVLDLPDIPAKLLEEAKTGLAANTNQPHGSASEAKSNSQDGKS